MTNKEAKMIMLNEQPHSGKKMTFTEEEKYEAFDMAIQALEQIKQIKEIINAPVYIQENVFRYQMICEVIRDDKS